MKSFSRTLRRFGERGLVLMRSGGTRRIGAVRALSAPAAAAPAFSTSAAAGLIVGTAIFAAIGAAVVATIVTTLLPTRLGARSGGHRDWRPARRRPATFFARDMRSLARAEDLFRRRRLPEEAVRDPFD